MVIAICRSVCLNHPEANQTLVDEFAQNMQLRPTGSHSFWDFSKLPFEVVERVKQDVHWVRWQERTWLCKQRAVSICEVAGYQIAEALNLPLQPWAAFFRNERANQSDPRKSSRKIVGILVERWQHCSSDIALWEPAATNPETVGRALALGVLDRSEWPRWLTNDDGSDLRLHDLEYTGPFLCWPPQRTTIKFYREHTKGFFDQARTKVCAVGIISHFEKNLEKLCSLNFRQLIDFGGHPHAKTMENAIVRGLEARQLAIRRILSDGFVG